MPHITSRVNWRKLTYSLRGRNKEYPYKKIYSMYGIVNSFYVPAPWAIPQYCRKITDGFLLDIHENTWTYGSA
jgi:hypothetical protein